MQTINCPIRQFSLTSPKSVAVHFLTSGVKKYAISYAELDRLVSHQVTVLKNKGIKRGDIIAFCDNKTDHQNSKHCYKKLKNNAYYKDEKLTSRLAHIVLLFSCLRLGAIFSPISERSTTNEKLQQLRNSPIDYLIQTDNHNILSEDKQITEFLPYNRTEFIIDQIECETTNRECSHRNIPINPFGAATLIFTSGSSGTPKAALHSFANHYYSALGSAKVIPVEPKNCWLASLPFYHIGGLALVFRCFLVGASIALSNKKLAQTLVTLPITHLSLVPTQLYRLIADNINWQSLDLRYLLLGGAAINNKVLTELNNKNILTFCSYGLTEMSSQVATYRLTKPTDNYFSKPLEHRQWKVINNEIALKGDTLFLGYLQAGKITRPLKNGWFYSKDLAQVSHLGLSIIGRKDNMFVCGGENYQPEIIEKQISKHPLVEQLLIVDIPSKQWGAIPIAIIKLTSSNKVTQQTDITRIKEETLPAINKIKHPKKWLVWPDNAPKTMKPKRRWFKAYALSRVKYAEETSR